MNAATSAATLVSLALGHEPIGVHHGYRGLIDDELALLRALDVADALRSRGTLL
jgi:6-phosphofructokinase